MASTLITSESLKSEIFLKQSLLIASFKEEGGAREPVIIEFADSLIEIFAKYLKKDLSVDKALELIRCLSTDGVFDISISGLRVKKHRENIDELEAEEIISSLNKRSIKSKESNEVISCHLEKLEQKKFEFSRKPVSFLKRVARDEANYSENERSIAKFFLRKHMGL